MEYGKTKQDLGEIWNDMKKHPLKTLGLLLFICFATYGVIAAGSIVATKASKWVNGTHASNPYRSSQTIYSNIVPLEHDIINLDHSGTLTPSPYNVLHYTISSEGACNINGTPLPYSKGIVLISNLPTVLSSRDFNDSSKPARGISFSATSTPASSYFSFELGKSHEISTGGRVFKIVLSRINDLSTEQNGEYYSYVFDINEK